MIIGNEKIIENLEKNINNKNVSYAYREALGSETQRREGGGGASCYAPPNVARSHEPTCAERHRHRRKGQ